MPNAMLSVTALRKSYGRVAALDGVDLEVPRGALTAVLGPSGCGKTTLLRCVAGFERVHGGAVALGGRRVAGMDLHVPPHRRRVAVVPQEGALFPHLSVADNVAYGLDRAARRSGRVEEVLALVGLPGYGDRMPHQLSGGQQQRVAVARALAPRPPLVLLDEPFSALDAGLRGDLRRDVRRALRVDGATAVLVTHDQGEALSMADEVAVMRAGRIIQCGPPAAVYREPATAWVAGFVGEAVLLPATVLSGTADGPVAVTPLGRLALRGPAPEPTATVLLRPEQVRLAPTGGTPGAGGASGTAGTPGAGGAPGAAGAVATVVRHDFHGHDALVHLRLADGTPVTARILDASPSVSVGDEVMVAVRGEARAFPPAVP